MQNFNPDFQILAVRKRCNFWTILLYFLKLNNTLHTAIITRKTSEELQKKDEEETSYIRNTTTWTGLTSRVIYRVFEDRERWKEIVKGAALVANISDDVNVR